ncbi:MAG: hypothetical protein U9N54_11465 [candidate division Zixibacteria bacterium]|nr:hypothetical protein [candidate division Zixibacteria bacterium]
MMFKRILTIVLISVILSLSINAQEFTLDNITGQVTPGQLPTGTPLYFNFRFTNNLGTDVTGFTNGFRFYSNDDATWTNISEPYGTYSFYTGAFGSMVDGGIFPDTFSWDGQEADTFSIGGFCMFGSCIPHGFDEIVLSVGVVFNSSENGKHFGLDSCFYPPGGDWLWNTSSGSVAPYWDGPHNYTIEELPCLHPVFLHCGDIGDVTNCMPLSSNFVAYNMSGSSEPITYSLIYGPGQVDPNTGRWTYEPSEADVGLFDVVVQATSAEEECISFCCAKKGNFTNLPPDFPAACASYTYIVQEFTATLSCEADPQDCDELTYSVYDVSPVPDGIYSMDAVTGLLSFTPAATDLGNFQFQVQVTDGYFTLGCPITFNVFENCCDIRGDVDHSGGPTPIGISDLTFLVDYLFNQGATPTCMDEADIDNNQSITISDLTYLVDYLFITGDPAPVACE